jgi:diguanylate cyclase (GGDEF)-like protein/PAS domain S-box-containing protein
MIYEKQGIEVSAKLSDALLSYLRIEPTPLVVSKSNKILWINDALEDLIATGIDEVINKDITEIVVDNLPSANIRGVEGSGTAYHNTGREIDVHVQVTPVGNGINVIKITPMSFTKNENETTIFRERLWVLANQITIGVFYSEVGARIQFANDALAHIYESPIETLLGTGWIDQIPPKQRQKVEKAILETLTGQRSSIEVKITTLSDREKDVLFTLSPTISTDSMFGFTATAEDITERLQREQEMERAALYDSLTGLRNRKSLNQLYQEHLDDLRNGEIDSISAIFCDLNKFKTVNDTYGHNAGDRVLVSFATALSDTLGSNLVPYRYAGDEFVVIAKNLTEKELRETVNELRIKTSLEVSFDNTIIKTSASFGYYTVTSTKHTLSELIAEADGAMYKDKLETKPAGEEN